MYNIATTKAGVHMEFLVIGISYKDTEVALREQCVFTDTKCISFYDEMLSLNILQVLLLSTCNRSEVYALCEEEQIEKLKEIFIRYTTKDIEPFLFIKRGMEAVLYLFEVCAGYHSLVVGEDQILHQMKNAYELSCATGACGKEMHKIFQSCFSSARNLKRRMKDQQVPISIAYLAMQKLTEKLSLEDKTMMIIGNGEMAELMRVYALEAKVKHLIVCNRTKEHIEDKEGIDIISFSQRYQVLTQCDVVCSATASPHMILKKEQMPCIQRPLYMIDLAIPRDIDQQLQHDKYIQLVDMDDLQTYANLHMEKRRDMLENYHSLLVKDSEELWEWLQHHAYDKTIMTLQTRSEEMAKQTFTLLKRKLNLSTHEEYILQKVLYSSFMRLMKEPVMKLKTLEQSDQLACQEMLIKLFQGGEEA